MSSAPRIPPSSPPPTPLPPPTPAPVRSSSSRAPRAPGPGSLARHWGLDPAVVFLNHGSFGGVPNEVMDELRRRYDHVRLDPVRYIVEELEGDLDVARRAMAAFVRCDAEGFAFVCNASAGVNTVIRSLRFQAGDEILSSNHEYNACNNVIRWAESRWGVRGVYADVPFPLRDEEDVVRAVRAKVTSRTRLVLLSHITSPTALVLPAARLVRELNERGIDTLVDGAHGPAFLDLDVSALGCAYYTGNFHKWLCAPMGSAFLWVREDRRSRIRPAIISHGANASRADRSRYRLEADFVGSMDYTPWLVTPFAMRHVGALVPGGWPEIRARNNALALRARDLINARLGAEAVAPDAMLGSMACVRLPDRTAAQSKEPSKYHDALQDALLNRWRIQVPIIPFGGPASGGGGTAVLGAGAAGPRYVRISAQVYNTVEQYEYLADALEAELDR
ncbi:MAG: aminotransferase class V-fold PLP-dependent enzyme [Phycisphaerae bacterium]|nr:aminotransferase class V-fold PLP-dependent enzyme [Phycisphaerae bacterium]